MNTSSWKGSEDPDVKSGVGTFYISGNVFTLNLESFNDYLLIEKMIKEAFKSGCSTTGERISKMVQFESSRF